MKPIIPTITMDIIKAKKQLSSNRPPRPQVANDRHDLFEHLSREHKGATISHLIKIGVVDKTSQLFKERCADCLYFPFSIALERQNCLQSRDHHTSSQFTTKSKSKDKSEGRIELIATSYQSLKVWTLGINMLL